MLRVHRGAEVSHGMVLELGAEALRRCTLGDGDYLLLEPPYTGPAPFIDRMVSDLQEKGFRVLLAHPERIGAFQRDPGLLQRLVEQGCLTSVTAGSVAGQFGGAVKRFTADLFAGGLVHNLASDAHDARYRSPALAPTLAKACAELPGLDYWLDYLTVAVPVAVLAGEAPPGVPPVLEPKRGMLQRLRRR
jgi:protein-tyrosine phosphatase